MFEYIHNLSESEKNLVLNAPLYVTILVAGADGEISHEEKKKAIEIIHIKSFAEGYEMREIYKNLEYDVAHELRTLIAALPEATTERNQYLSDLLAGLNQIFPKLDKNFAVKYYKSLREFAHYIAHAEGGFWGVASVSSAEKEVVKLPMIMDPLTQA